MNAKLDETMFMWLKQQREKGLPITGRIPFKIESELYEILYSMTSQPKAFTAST